MPKVPQWNKPKPKSPDPFIRTRYAYGIKQYGPEEL